MQRAIWKGLWHWIGKDWGQEEKGATADEMVGWHHWLNGHEFEQAPGDGEGQGSPLYCSPWGHKESDTTNWTAAIQIINDDAVQPLSTWQTHSYVAPYPELSDWTITTIPWGKCYRYPHFIAEGSEGRGAKTKYSQFTWISRGRVHRWAAGTRICVLNDSTLQQL